MPDWVEQTRGIPPEPPDGTRLEFNCCTDLYAVWRDDAASEEAGHDLRGGDRRVWVIYPGSVAKSWAELYDEFGDALWDATHWVLASDRPPLDVGDAFIRRSAYEVYRFPEGHPNHESSIVTVSYAGDGRWKVEQKVGGVLVRWRASHVYRELYEGERELGPCDTAPDLYEALELAINEVEADR